MKLNTRIIISILEIGLIPILLWGYIGFFNTKKQITENTFTKLEAISQIQKNRLQSLFDTRLDLLNLFTSRTLLRSLLRDFNRTPSSFLQKSLSANLIDAKSNNPKLKIIFVVNPDGKIVASTDPSLLDSDVSAEVFFKQGILRNNVSILKKDNFTGQISEYLVGPIEYEGQIIGMAAIVIDAQDIVSVAEDYTGLGNTGETLFVRNDGQGNVLFITPTRFNSSAALSLVIPKEESKIASTYAIKGIESIFANVLDYRKIPVFAATRYVESVNWGIVVKIDQEEALSQVKKTQILLVYLIFVTAFLIVAIGTVISRSITIPIKSLAVTADKLANADFSTTTTTTGINSNDEIGMLARSFNVMSMKLRQYYGELAQIVKEKTQELSKRVLDLEHAKVAARNVLEDLQVEQQRLSETFAKEEAILASIGDGMIAIDEKVKVIVANDAIEKLMGFKKGEIFGKSWFQVAPMEDEKGNAVPDYKRPIMQAILNKKSTTTSTSTYYFVRKDKTKFPVAVTATPILLNGKVIGAIGIYRDITHEMDIDKAKTEFVSLASHQLRTPLGIMKWYLEVLQKDDYLQKAPQQDKEYFDQIYKSNERVLNLVRDLLSVSRIDQGRIKNVPKRLNILEIISDTVTQMQVLAKSKGVALELVQIAKNLPSLNIDPLRFHEVIENLLANAIEYTPAKGKVEVNVVSDNDLITINIKDTGMGISTSDKSKIFNKFFRTPKAVSENPEGSGLGLYVVKSYVEGWGGQVLLESTVGKGSTFTLKLPIKNDIDRKVVI